MLLDVRNDRGFYVFYEKYDIVCLFVFCGFFLSALSEQIAQTVEIFFENNTDALGVHAVSSKIPVVGLIINLYGNVAVWEE